MSNVNEVDASPDSGWRRGTGRSLEAALRRSAAHYGMTRDAGGELARHLVSGGWAPATDYYVPALEDLVADYRRLAQAHLHGWIGVGWVMCRESHDALAARYADQRWVPMPVVSAVDYTTDAQVLDDAGAARNVMVNALGLGGTSTLMGMPIRIDPAARRPMFELQPAGGRE
ncbi:hypothetical protein [Dactylosporangium sp. CS-033363]|uniref:hypothetical protein n=1 Tax=Dactylosporangium sp. CS-033363 TaxID=3239935 RepID=UPI003D920FB2